MSQFDAQEPEREPTRESVGPDQPTETRADVVATTILTAILGGITGWMFAWGADMSITWQIAVAIAGAIVPGGLVLIRPIRHFLAGPARARRWATQEDNYHKPVGDVVVGYMQRREGWTVLYAVICGAIGGGSIGWVVGGPVGSMYGAAIGVVVWLVLNVVLVACIGAIWIKGARTFGPIVNTGCTGALVGALAGMEIWRRNWDVAWPNIGALVVGIPMAALFLLVGYGKAKKQKQQS